MTKNANKTQPRLLKCPVCRSRPHISTWNKNWIISCESIGCDDGIAHLISTRSWLPKTEALAAWTQLVRACKS